MIIVADKMDRTDGPAHTMLQKVNSELPIVLVSRVDGFVFNDALLSLAGKDWVLFDFVENGWNWQMEESHIWGKNTSNFDFFNGDEYKKLDEFIKNNPPVVSFVRELLKADASDKVVPIQYPCWHEVPQVQSREEFNARLFEVFYSWGLSHEHRKTIHGDIWQKSGKYGYSVCDNIFYVNSFLSNESAPRKWLTMNIPHYARQPMEIIVQVNGMAKISFSPPGAGRSCFRSAESPINSVMLMLEDDIKWSHDWEHGVNCIKCKQGEEVETAIEWLAKDQLYDVYVAGVENCKNYQLDNYVKNYIEPILNQ